MTPDSSSFFYVDVELTNGVVMDFGFEHDGGGWQLVEVIGAPGICQGQFDTFTDYTLSILTSPSCVADPVYTPEEEAVIAWYVFEVENFCQDNQPPSCDPSVAPTILSMTPDSSSFFYVNVELTNGVVMDFGFEHDGGGWQLVEVIGNPDICQGQFDTFTNYTLSILTSPSCVADPVYTPAEEAVIAWYVFEVENFCQDNQPPSCSPQQPLALTAVDASSIPMTPNGCASQSWCMLESLRAWTIPSCLAAPPTTSEVVDLVLTEDQENSSLPWGTFMDRSGLSGTTFLNGSSGASLFNAIDNFTGSTYVEGWDFAVPVPCHNCTQYDVKTVIFYRNTSYVIALDGFYGWDS
jgi:hypothetical protein